jgi:hypothetical protein
MHGDVRRSANRPAVAGVDFLVTSALVASCMFIAWIILAH